MTKEKIFNLPNFLSLYRLLTFPLILWFIYSGKETLFAIFICINLITDILDGLIARTFNLQTKFGAKLDSLADNGTYIAAIIAIFTFKIDEISQDIWMLWVFIFLYVLGVITSLVKFKQFPSLHLYTTKIGGYIQGVFLFVLFAWSYNLYLFYVAMIIGFISHIEETAILLILKKMKSNAKGLYWVLKDNKTQFNA